MLFTLLLTALGSTPPEPAVVNSNYLLALAPENSVSVLAIGNLDEMREAAKKNSFVRFAEDEQVAALFNNIAGDAMEKLAAELQLNQVLGPDIDLAALLASLHGSVVLFSETPNQNMQDPLVGLMIELGDDRSGFDQVFSGFMDRMGNKMSVSGSDHMGVPVMSFRPKEARAEGVLHLAELGDAVVLMGGSGSPAAMTQLQGIIDRWSGASSTGGLLQSANFKSARGSLEFDPHIECYLDVHSLWSSLQNSGELRHAELPEDLLNEIGQVRWLHGGARIGTGEELDFQLGLDMPEEGIIASFAGLFGGIPIDLMRQVPRQSSSICSLSLDLHGLFNTANDLLRAFDEQKFNEAQLALQRVNDMGIDIEGNFLSQLTGGYVGFSVEVPASESLLGMAGSMAGAANGDDPLPSYASATIIGLQDPGPFKAGIDKILETFNQQKLTTDVANGQQAHSVNFGFFGVHWAFTPKSLVLGIQPTPVAEALRMLGDDSLSIMDKGRFAGPMQANRRAFHFSIRDTATNLKSAMGGLQSVSRMLPMLSMLTDFKVPEGFPINAQTPWPSPSIVSRYFEGTISSAVTWDESSLRLRLTSK